MGDIGKEQPEIEVMPVRSPREVPAECPAPPAVPEPRRTEPSTEPDEVPA